MHSSGLPKLRGINEYVSFDELLEAAKKCSLRSLRQNEHFFPSVDEVLQLIDACPNSRVVDLIGDSEHLLKLINDEKTSASDPMSSNFSRIVKRYYDATKKQDPENPSFELAFELLRRAPELLQKEDLKVWFKTIFDEKNSLDQFLFLVTRNPGLADQVLADESFLEEKSRLKEYSTSKFFEKIIKEHDEKYGVALTQLSHFRKMIKTSQHLVSISFFNAQAAMELLKDARIYSEFTDNKTYMLQMIRGGVSHPNLVSFLNMIFGTAMSVSYLEPLPPREFSELMTNPSFRIYLAEVIKDPVQKYKLIELITKKMPILFDSNPVRDMLGGEFEDPANIYEVARRIEQASSDKGDEKKHSQELPFQHVTFFTHVFSDGVGDLVICVGSAKLWKTYFPDMGIQIIAFVDNYEERQRNLHALASERLASSSIPFVLLDSGGVSHQPLNEVALAKSLDAPEFKKCDKQGIIEVSFRQVGLKNKLAERGVNPVYHGFWSEASLRVYRGTSQEQHSLVTNLEMLSTKFLRIGCELGFRIDPDLEQKKKALSSLSFTEKIAKLENPKLKKILSKTHNRQPFLYSGYMRDPHNLIAICRLIGKANHDKKSDIVNVWVKEIPRDLRCVAKKLRVWDIFPTIEVYNRYEEGSYTENQEELKSDGPLLRLIAIPVSLADSDLMMALSPMTACCGDQSVYQAFSLSSLTSQEKMKHDESFYRFIIFLAEKYLPGSQLGKYFRELFSLTAMIAEFPEFLDGFFEKQFNQICALIEGDNFEKLTNDFQRLIGYIKEHHNLEKNIKNFPKWYQTNVWDVPGLRKITQCPFRFISSMPLPSVTHKEDAKSGFSRNP